VDPLDVLDRLTKRRTFAVVTESKDAQTHNLRGIRHGDLLVFIGRNEELRSASSAMIDRVAVMSSSGLRYQTISPEYIGAQDPSLGELSSFETGVHEIDGFVAKNLWQRILAAQPDVGTELLGVPAAATQKLNNFEAALSGFGVSGEVIELLIRAADRAQVAGGAITPVIVWSESLASRFTDGGAVAPPVAQPLPSEHLVGVTREQVATRLSDADQVRIREMLSNAEAIRKKTESRLIGVEHLLGGIAVRGELKDSEIDLRKLARHFAAVRTEPFAIWQAALNVEIPFNIANRPSTDIWTRVDSLGYAKYAQAIADSILIGDTPTPLTIGIQAPWGQGKTSLMRMIQERVDPTSAKRDERGNTSDFVAKVATTYKDFLRALRGAKSDRTGGFVSSSAETIPTVWFNPLYYREGTQVWAGLAHGILHQLAQQIDDRKEREEFWLRLQLARINIDTIRSDVNRWLITRAIPLGLFWIAVAFALVLLMPPSFAIFGGVAGFIATAYQLQKRVLDRPFEKYITEPGYEAQLGMLHLVDHDLDRALRLLVGNRRIAIFIDDLDRCDPQTVNQIILAINQFLSLPNRNVYFFLGMDMEMVAGALEQAQKDAGGAAPERRGRTFGWRFMEKFIQLPFVIPHLDAATAKQFATSHLRPTVKSEKKVDVDKVIEAAQSKEVTTTEIGRMAKEIANATDISSEERTILEQVFSKRTTELMHDPESDEIKRIVDIAIDDLELNPRTIKRYFCLVRVLRNIQIATGKVENADADRRLVLRAAHLLLNWPQFVQWLRNMPIADVQTALNAAKNSAAWSEELKKLLRHDPPPYLSDPSLYGYLRKLAQDPPGLGEMYAARMF